MKLTSLLNRHISTSYDLMFLFVEDIEGNYALLEKFYVNEREYQFFVEYLTSNDNEDTQKKFKHVYSYVRYTQRVRLNDFEQLFSIVPAHADKLAYINEINSHLKDLAIRIDNHDAALVQGYEVRQVVNKYFDDRHYIFEKNTENFPLHLNLGIDEATSVVFRMYNVGQANMSALLVDGHPAMIFDLGKSRKCKEAIDLLQNQLPSNISGKETVIVISHFHDDHINMADYLPAGGASLVFLMPEPLHPTDIYKPNIELMLSKVIKNGGVVCFFLNEHLLNPLDFPNISFYQGEKYPRDLNQNSAENAHGIITCLSVDDKKVLIPGDCLYNDLYTNLRAPIFPDYVVIPHHGCPYRGRIDNQFIDLSSTKEAFVFCGPHGGYCHPNLSHFEQYRNAGARLVRLIRTGRSRTVFDWKSRISDTFFAPLSQPYYDWVLK